MKKRQTFANRSMGQLTQNTNKQFWGRGLLLSLLSPVLIAIPNNVVYAADEFVIEEITVTARRRSENLQEVPVSVTAYNDADVEELGITDISHISELTPNLMVMQNLGGSDGAAVCMRGQCRTDFTISEDPMVGVYVDGVYVSKSVGSLFDIAELESIEVLRGPQGTLYGKNTLGGALLLNTRKPSGEFGLKTTVTAGNYGRKNAKAYIEFPVSKELAASISYLSKKHDAYIENNFVGDPALPESIGNDREDENNFGLRAALHWTPNDNLTVDYGTDYQKKREAASSPQLTSATGSQTTNIPGIGDIPIGLGDNYAADVLPDREDELSSYGLALSDVDIKGHSLTVAYKINDDMTFKSITGYREIDNSWQNNSTGAKSALLYTDDRLRMTSMSQEFQLAGELMDSSINYVAGFFYANDEGKYKNDQVLEAFAADNLIRTNIDNTSMAFFGELAFNVTDQLELAAGIRYTDEEREADHFVTDNASGFTYFNTAAQTYAGAPTPFETEIDTSSTSPRLSASFQFSDDMMVYAVYAKGFKSGGFNARSFTPLEWEPYDDAEIDSFDVGLKSSWMDKRIRFNATLYHEEITDMQAQVNSVDPFSQTGFTVVVKNAAEATITGAELELLMRVVEGLEVSIGYGYTDADYDEFNSTDFVGATIDIADDRAFEYTPESSYNVSVSYTFPQFTSEGTLRARLDLSGQDETVFTPQISGNDDLVQDSYELVNLRIAFDGVSLGTGSIGVAAWVKNAADEEYKIGGYAIDAGNPDFGGLGRVSVSQWAEPRTFGFDVVYRYGAMM